MARQGQPLESRRSGALADPRSGGGRLLEVEYRTTGRGMETSASDGRDAAGFESRCAERRPASFKRRTGDPSTAKRARFRRRHFDTRWQLLRDPAKTNRIRGAMRRQFAWTAPPGCPPPFVMISWATAMAAHTLTNPGDRRGRCSGRRSNLQFRIDNRCHCSAHPSLRIRSLKRRPRQPAR